MVIFSMFLTTAWCVESRVAIPDPVHGWLGRMHDSTDRACFCHISTRGDGFGGFVPAAARVSRICWATNPTRGEWGTLAAVEDNLVPAATPCIRLIRDRNENHKTTFWPDTILAKQFKVFLWRRMSLRPECRSELSMSCLLGNGWVHWHFKQMLRAMQCR